MAVRVAIIDSGVRVPHPHIHKIAGGIALTSPAGEDTDFSDCLGHGTAVAAAILEKASEADVFAVKVFHRQLATQVDLLVRAIDWSLDHGMNLINLSLGTANEAHAAVLREAVERVVLSGAKLVAAHGWLPGNLPGAVPVDLDWACPRDEFRTEMLPDGRILYRASGFARPIPGVDPERNLKGISFAVANVTGLLARDYCL